MDPPEVAAVPAPVGPVDGGAEPEPCAGPADLRGLGLGPACRDGGAVAQGLLDVALERAGLGEHEAGGVVQLAAGLVGRGDPGSDGVRDPQAPLEVDLRSGERVLDVAAGNGNATLADFVAALVNEALTPAAPAVTISPETITELRQLITTELEAEQRWTAEDIMRREG